MRADRRTRPSAGPVVFLCLLAVLATQAPAALAAVDREVTPEEQAWLDEVSAEIERSGYDWIAGPTSVSHLSPEERARRLGGEIPPHIQAIYDTLTPDPAIERLRFRSEFDWRDHEGVTPADDQGDCGSCWAFGACGATEAAVRINEGIILDISEQQSVDCNFQGSDCDGGWAGHAYELHEDPGAVLEECYPYRAENGSSCRHYACEKVAIIDGFTNLTNTVATLKYACETYGPLSVGMCVYDDFYGYQNGCYEHAGSDPTNHGVLLVGWDDSMCGGQGAWICKNSWGRGFGENGFFYIKYNTCRIGAGAMRPTGVHVPKDRLVPDEYTSIGDALTAARRGDIVKVAAGTYPGSLLLPDYVSLVGGYDPTFTDRDPDLYPTIIDGEGSGHVIKSENRSYILIDGFEIVNSGGGSSGLQLLNSDVKVRNCDVHDCWRGVTVTYGGGAPRSKNAIIEYSTVRDNDDVGIFINDAENPRVQVRWTAIHGNGTRGIYSFSTPTDIINCTVAMNGSGAGIEISVGASNVIKNCIVVSNTGYGIACSGASAEITYNDVWNNSLGDYSGCSGGDGSISDDPIFCDAPTGDVSVHATSPTLDAGEFNADMGALGIGCPIGPQGLEVAQVGASLELSWSRPPPERADVDYYIVYRDTTALPNVELATVDAPDTTFTDVTIPPCLLHNYRVSAVDLGGLEGAGSNRVQGELCYSAPHDITADFSEEGNSTAWEPGGGPVDYYVVRRGTETADPDSIGVVTAPGTSYFDSGTGDCPRDSYTYEVLPVYDTSWRGLMSGPAGVDPLPAPPTGLSAEWVGPDIVLTWAPNCESDFRRYWVYRDTIPLSPPPNSDLLIGFLADTTFVDEGPNPDWTYFYRLTASDAGGEKSEYSDLIYLGTGTTLTVPVPYGSIQAAIDAASAIDTVVVSPGTYGEALTLKDGVIVVSTDGAAATTVGWPSGSVVTASGLSDFSLFRGFTVDGGGAASNCIDCWGSYVRIEDCVFTGAQNGASFRFGGAPEVTGNEFRNSQNGVSVADSSAPVLSGNVFDGNLFSGLYTMGDPGPIVGGSLAKANDFLSNGFYQLFNLGTAETRAELNYWGDVCVDPAWFFGPADYLPWTDADHSGSYTECPDGVPDGDHPERAFASYNYPNPFNPATAISYAVPAPGGRVGLSIYDLSGRKVRTLVDEEQGPGRRVAIWNGRDDRDAELGSGVYFYRLEVGGEVFQRKMVMLK